MIIGFDERSKMGLVIQRDRLIDEDGNESTTLDIQDDYRKPPKPWVKVYLDAWATFKDIKGFSDLTCDVLYRILCLYPAAVQIAKQRTKEAGEYVAPVISIDMTDKEFWSATLKVPIASINNAITKLVKMGMIERVSRGRFVINPELVGCGSERSMEMLRAISGTFQISAEGAIIKPTFHTGNASKND